MLQTYKPKQSGRCVVTVTPTSFKFSALARDTAKLGDIHWMRVHTDPDDRLIVFEPFVGLDREPRLELLKLGTSKGGHKTLTAKGLVNSYAWIKAVTTLDMEQRRFEMKPYPGQIPAHNIDRKFERPWYIQLMPTFEESVIPSQLGLLVASKKGIYRYLSGDEIVYIGKGSIRDRYQNESRRKDWGVSKIQYSVIEDDQKAFEWESWWLERFRKENNGHLPRYNLVVGHRGE